MPHEGKSYHKGIENRIGGESAIAYDMIQPIKCKKVLFWILKVWVSLELGILVGNERIFPFAMGVTRILQHHTKKATQKSKNLILFLNLYLWLLDWGNIM